MNDRERLLALQDIRPEIMLAPCPVTTDGTVYELFVGDAPKGRSYYGDDLAEAVDRMVEGEARHRRMIEHGVTEQDIAESKVEWPYG